MCPSSGAANIRPRLFSRRIGRIWVVEPPSAPLEKAEAQEEEKNRKISKDGRENC
jgi:hypothetical protein